LTGPTIGDAELATLEREVWAALEAGETGGLRVLGYGEITLVLGWPADAPRVACKRLPVFADAARADTYGATIDEYVRALADRGVDVVASEWRTVTTRGGETAAYLVQPVLPADTLVVSLLHDDPPGAVAILERIMETIMAIVDEQVGLDGQASNWALVDGRLRYFDVTTPMLAGADGRTRLDLGLLTMPLPAALRGVVRRAVAPSLVAHYHRPRDVLVDLIGNLRKERLDHLVEPAIARANAHVDRRIDRDEIDRWYRSDARTWEALLRLRRADRWWQRHVRRRTYPYLLPGPIER
jgi:hypothetical protein